MLEQEVFISHRCKQWRFFEGDPSVVAHERISENYPLVYRQGENHPTPRFRICVLLGERSPGRTAVCRIRDLHSGELIGNCGSWGAINLARTLSARYLTE
jgi:hypothetical protein